MTRKLPKARILWVSHGQTKTCLLHRTPFSLGRLSENDLTFEGSSISRRHAQITFQRDSFFIQDQTSSCGTYVNGVRLVPGHRARLRSGDLIRLGRQIVQFQLSQSRFRPEWVSDKSDSLSVTHPKMDEALRTLRQRLIAHFEHLTPDVTMRKQFTSFLDISLGDLATDFKAKLREYRTLQEMMHMIGHILNTQELLATALELVTTVLSADRGFILLFDPQAQRLVPAANHLFDPSDPDQAALGDFSFSHTVAADCFSHREIILIHDALRDERLQHAKSVMTSRIRSVTCIPLVHEDEAFGVIYLDNLTQVGCFQQHQIDFLEALGAQISIALANARLYTQAVTDELTHLYNRKLIVPRIREELSRSKRYQRSCGLILLDIDFFKRVNDRLGHPAGDEVLVQLADRLKKIARVSDFVARFGGEEFLILLPETDEVGARKLADRLLAAVHEKPFQVRDQPVHLTISLGVTVNLGDDDRAAHMIDRADRALYQAKSAGRNCVVVFRDPGSPDDSNPSWC